MTHPTTAPRIPGFIGTACAIAAVSALLGQPAAAEDSAGTAEAMSHATALSKAFRHAAEHATPSVVVVRSEARAKPAPQRQRQRQGGGENPFKGTPFEDFFKDGLPEGFEFGPRGGMPPRSGVGSGVIVDAAGIVLTNNHVVEGADEVTVELPDGREFKATEIKTDPESDLAVVRLGNAKDLPVAKLGDSDKLEIGDWVIAIGNPFELETTVSAGIISGKGRELGSIRRAKFLQTDAAINPGNSGGPLVNLAGEVVGINTAIASSSGGYQGVGFAIPINLAKWVSGQLIARGSVERGYLGVSISPISTDMAAKLGVRDRKGALVTEVMPGTPAAEAGVEEFDVIVGFDGQPVDGPRSLQEVVERSGIGQKHKVAVLRDGKTVELAVSVKPLPDKVAKSGGGGLKKGPGVEETYYAEQFGLEVRDKNSVPEDAYAGFEGVLVDRVDPDGIAAEAGLGPGYLIRKIGHKTVTSVAEFAAAIEKESAEDGILVGVRTPRGNSIVLLKKND
ncbi:MAG: Do family serine endopeptidase [Planctomycetia bacterium]|nr:Do family serine endopeptidase [Planctomycetia bacterium]